MEHGVNLHHIYFDRRSWNRYESTSRIRNLEQSKVILPIEVHNDLHANTSPMAIVSPRVARLAISHMLNRPEYSSPLDSVLDSEEYFREIGDVENRDARNVADKLAEQIPFIRIGVDSLKKRYI